MKKITRLCATALSAAFLTALAPNPSGGRAQACVVYEDLARLDYPLTRTMRDIMSGQAIKIVAIGSSSTAGAGASSPDNTYPAQLERKLRAQFPGARIDVINRGQNGDTIKEMLARLEASVLSEKPQLVLLQAGTNTVLRDGSLPDAERLMMDAIFRLRVQDIDVVLIDQQFAPKVNEKPNSQAMLGILKSLSDEFGISVFRRHTLMQRWHDKEAMPFHTFIHPDQLHMNDWSYACVAESLSRAIGKSIAPAALALYHHP